MLQVFRDKKNPILQSEDIRPLSGEYEVVGVLNPGVTYFNGKTLLLIRVAERPKDKNDGFLRVPVFSEKTKKMEIICFDKSDKSIDFSDSRTVKLSGGDKFLTSYSSLMIAESENGTDFVINQNFRIMPKNIYEAYGIEDARITKIGDIYYINYTAPSEYGICTAFITTKDFVDFSEPLNIMHPDNKDVAIFPEKIGGYYYAFHRPSTSEFGSPNIWIAKSPDLVCWGDHRLVLAVRKGRWDGKRIGASSIPIRTAEGWLMVYHGCDAENAYSLGAVLFDLDMPWRVKARSDTPFLVPEEPYERVGFFQNVVFSCGCTEQNGLLKIYYGAADTCICRADVSLNEVLGSLKKENEVQ